MAGCLALSACEADDPTRSTAPTSPGATTPAAAVSPTPVFAPEEEVLNVAIQEPSTLDPMRLQDPGGVLVARQLYEGLTRWDPVEEEVVPAAAESWTVSDGGRRFTFKLREGMTFHDGTQVEAKDFKYAFERIALKRNASDVAYTLETIEGFVEVNQIGGTQRLSGISVRGPLTIVFQLARPYHDFPAVLTHPSLVPLPQRAVADPDRFLRVPVGNGPFHIAEPWTPGDPVLLRAFAGFIDTPNLDGIRFLSFPDAAASWLLFRDGEIDVAEVPAGEIAAATEEFGDRAFQPFLATYNFGLNLDAGALGNIKVRRAINRAIDREAIAENVYRGSMTPARGIVPIGMPGFLENICVDLCDYSPEVAERLVNDLPRRARRIRVEYAGDQPHPRVAQMVRRDLEGAGFDVTLRRFGFAKYVRRLQRDDHHVYRLGWIAEVPTADAFLYPLFASESPDNHSGFASEEVDRLLARAHATRSDAKRVQMYIDAEKAIMRRVPIVPIGSFTTHWAAHGSVSDIVFDQMGGFDAVDVTLAS